MRVFLRSLLAPLIVEMRALLLVLFGKDGLSDVRLEAGAFLKNEVNGYIVSICLCQGGVVLYFVYYYYGAKFNLT